MTTMTDSAVSASLPPGARVHELIIQQQIGRGGAGIVYAAEHAILGETLAVKEFLPVELARRGDGFDVVPLPGQEVVFEGLKQKFLQEGKTLVELARPKPHPNIVQVTDAFRANDTVYLCMRFERGEPLSALVRTAGKLGAQDVRKLLVPLLDGLAHAHKQGVLHRDIKPANILVRHDGSPVLIDFGAAHKARPDGQVSVVAQYTPDFAAPEQLIGGEQGPWTDLYCLAATCVYCLTGHPPDRSRATLAPDGPLSELDPQFRAALGAALDFDWNRRPRDVPAWRLALGLEKTAVEPAPSSAWSGAYQREALTGDQTQVSGAATGRAGARSAALEAERTEVLRPSGEAHVVADQHPAPAQPMPDRLAIRPPAASRESAAGSQGVPARRPWVRASFYLGLPVVLLLAGGLWWWFVFDPDGPGVERSAGFSSSAGSAARQRESPEPRSTDAPNSQAAREAQPQAKESKLDGQDLSTTPVAAPGKGAALEAKEEPTMDPARVVAQLAARFDCARLRTEVRSAADGSEILRLQGYLRDPAQLGQLKQSLSERLPEVRADLAGVRFAAPFCRTLTRLNGVVASVPAHPGQPDLAFNEPLRIYHQDDYLALSATQPGGAAGFLYLDFIDRDGGMGSLLPNPELTQNFIEPGGHLEVGVTDAERCAREPDNCFIASEPHGNNLILAIWSARPLEPDWHIGSSASESLPRLESLIARQAQADGGAVSLSYHFLTTAR